MKICGIGAQTKNEPRTKRLTWWKAITQTFAALNILQMYSPCRGWGGKGIGRHKKEVRRMEIGGGRGWATGISIFPQIFSLYVVVLIPFSSNGNYRLSLLKWKCCSSYLRMRSFFCGFFEVTDCGGNHILSGEPQLSGSSSLTNWNDVLIMLFIFSLQK